MLTSVPMTQTLDDAFSAWTTRRIAFAEDEWGHRELYFSAVLGVVLIVLLAFCAWIAIATPDDSSHPLKPLRFSLGAVAILFLLAAMLSYRMGTKDADGAPCPGPITARFQPAFGNVSPMPPMPTFDAAVLWTTTHSAQFRIFNGFVIAAAALALVLLGPLLLRYTIALARRPASPTRN
jgi:heme A synthase